ncbi:MAG: PLP-dependent transferase [Candidatus Competibacteraceae bacterium]
MDRHCENAVKAAEYLRDHPQVTWIKYPALADNPEEPLVDKHGRTRLSILVSASKAVAKPAPSSSTRCNW